MPNGLTLSSAGAIAGVPSATGTFTFTIDVVDTSKACTASQSFTIIINGSSCPAITLSPISLPVGTVGTGYLQTLVGSGGLGPYTFSVIDGSLPSPLMLDMTTGHISGTPTAAGTSMFTVQATDVNGCSVDRVYSIIINAVACDASSTPEISPATLPNGILGQSYAQSIGATGGSGENFWQVLNGNLPPGLTLSVVSGGAAATITGTPLVAGTFDFTILSIDTNPPGCSGTMGYSIVISAVSGFRSFCTAPRFLTRHLPEGTVGGFYARTIHVSRGNRPIQFTIVAGDLPPGLFLDSFTGEISGVPTGAGKFCFEVSAKSRCGKSSIEPLSITISR